jgi:Ca2+-binding RTX toxin-like protein
MPIQTTNIDANGDGYTIAGNYSVYVIASGVSVLTAYGIAVQSNNTSNLIDNFGLLAGGAGDGVALYGSSVACSLINEAKGSIAGYDAVIVNGSNDQVVNYGIMTGYDDGIEIFGGSGTHVQNYGQITGKTTGVNEFGLNDVVLNDGAITSTGTGYLFSSSSGTSTLHNLGTISGMTAAISSSGGGAIVIKNIGSLVGDVALTDVGGDTVVNRGSIDGDVQLGNYTNTFNGVRGTVHGAITGGTNVDIIRAGNDGETIGGGGGHDQLYGGAGADVFVFASITRGDTDTVHGFNVAGDTIELSSASFTSLIAGESPEFSIGKTATSATDHLYYNAKSGGLFYDSDGTGEHPAFEIAEMAKGLRLTTNDFLVV